MINNFPPLTYPESRDVFEYQTPIEKLLKLQDDTFASCRTILLAKNKDYTAGTGDPFSNFRISELFDVNPVTGIMLRMSDKMQRIRAFVKNGVLAVAGESVDDACDDIINYAILAKGLLQEQRAAAALKASKDSTYP